MNSTYHWRKQFLDAGTDVFSIKCEQLSQRAEAVSQRPEKQGQGKDSLNTVLIEDNIALKKGKIEWREMTGVSFKLDFRESNVPHVAANTMRSE